MRIGTLFFNDRITSDMLKTQAEMAETQMQLSSGRRIQTPSDDPSGAKTVLDTEKFVATTEQYQENILQVRSRLELEETVMANSSDIMQRLREIAIQGANGTYTAEQRGMMAEEVEQLLDELLSLANTKDSNDEYLFSGFSRQTPPVSDGSTYPAARTAAGPPATYAASFSYQGDQGERLVPIASNRKVADAENGFEAFFGLPDQAGGITDIFSTAYNLAADLRENPPITDFSRSLDNLDSALDQVIQVRSKAGARLATVEQQQSANEDFILHFETQLASVRDLDYAEAITRFNRQTTALQAAQQSYVQIQGLSLFNYIR